MIELHWVSLSIYLFLAAMIGAVVVAITLTAIMLDKERDRED